MAERHIRFQEEWLSAAVDGELSAAEQAVFEQTIAVDANLRREYEILQALKSCVHRAAPTAELPASLTARLRTGLDAIDAATPPASAAPWRRWWQPAFVLAGALAMVSFVLPLRPSAVVPDPAPGTPARLNLQAGTLAKAHRDWQAHYASQPQATETPQQMAAALSQKIGYAVAAPDPGRLQARLRGCSTCSHSVPGMTAAVFVMTRSAAAPLSLFEVAGSGCTVDTPGFVDSAQPGVRIATVNGVSLACWRAAGGARRAGREQADAEALAKLAPQRCR